MRCMEKFTRTMLLVASLATTVSAFAGHGWKRVNYTQSTIFTGIVTVNGKPASSGDVVGIFVNGECRMLSTVFLQNDTAYVSAVLHGEKIETATVQYWCAADNTISKVDTTIISKPSGEINRFPINVKSSSVVEEPIAQTNNPLKSSEFRLYPSPVKNNLMVSNFKDVQSLVVYDNIGNKVVEEGGGKNSFDVSALPTGIYFVTVLSVDGHTVTKRIVKE